jgi:hypothetical protein
VKLTRLFLYLFILLAIAGGVLLLPAFQTWYVNYQLDNLGIKDASLNFFSASFGKLSIEDFSIKKPNAILTLPSLDAELPITKTIKNKTFHIKNLEAKGWTLDLSPKDKTSTGAIGLSDALQSIVQSSPIPSNISIDKMDLEGQIILPGINNRPNIHVQIEINSGTLNADGVGKISVNISTILGDPEMLVNGLRYQGDITFKLDSKHHLSEYTLDGICIPTGVAFPDGRKFHLNLTEKSSSSQEHAFDTLLSLADEPVLKVQAYFNSNYTHVRGNWSLFTDQSIIGNFVSINPMPLFQTQGMGNYTYDVTTKELKLSGNLAIRLDQLEKINQSLRTANNSSIMLEFKSHSTPTHYYLDTITGNIQANQTLATFNSTQPIKLSLDTTTLDPSLINTELLLVHLKQLPVTWLNFFCKPFELSGNTVSGDISIQNSGTGYKIKTLKKISCSNFNLTRDGKDILTNLSAQGELEVSTATDGLHYTINNLSTAIRNKPALTLSGTAFRANDQEQPSQFSFKLNSSIQTLANYFNSHILSVIKADQFTGDITGNITPNSTTLESHLALTGTDPTYLINLSPRIDFFPNHTEALFIPIAIKHEDQVTDLTIEGSLSHEQNLTAFEAKATGDKVNTLDLALLNPWLLLDKSLLSQSTTKNEALWANTSGKVLFEFSHLVTPTYKINEFSALFEVEPDHIHMKGARGIFPSTHSFTSEGTIYFSKDKNLVYRLDAKASMNELPSSEFLAAPKKGFEPIFEGKFSCDADFTVESNSLLDLLNSPTKTLHLHSTSGIVRMLKVNIGDTIPQNSSTVKDTLGSVGQKMGSFFQMGDHLKKYQENEVSQNAENALAITNELSEFGYDTLKVNAVVSPSGDITLQDIAITSSDLNITGLGSITNSHANFCDGSLNLSLTLSAKGKVAELLKKSNLAASHSVIPNFTQLNQTILIKGTLNQVDLTQWHDLLGKQANIPDPPGSKPETPKRKTPKEIEESRTLQDSELGLLPQ